MRPDPRGTRHGKAHRQGRDCDRCRPGHRQGDRREVRRGRATVVVTDLDEANAKEAATAWPGAVAIRADVTDRQGVQTMVNRVVQQFGRIDVLVNNAGWDKASPFAESEPADWDRAIAVNLYGRSCARPSPGRSRSGGSASRMTSPTSWRSSPRTRHPSSPARRSASAAASR
jgi:NAD(P)-dependent dehydrogenase (short-subunit alcohol dehydrogenase family)